MLCSPDTADQLINGTDPATVFISWSVMGFVFLEYVGVDGDEILVAVGLHHLLGEVSRLEFTTHVNACGQIVAGVIILESATHPAQAVLLDRRTQR